MVSVKSIFYIALLLTIQLTFSLRLRTDDVTCEVRGGNLCVRSDSLVVAVQAPLWQAQCYDRHGVCEKDCNGKCVWRNCPHLDECLDENRCRVNGLSGEICELNVEPQIAYDPAPGWVRPQWADCYLTTVKCRYWKDRDNCYWTDNDLHCRDSALSLCLRKNGYFDQN